MKLIAESVRSKIENHCTGRLEPTFENIIDKLLADWWKKKLSKAKTEVIEMPISEISESVSK